MPDGITISTLQRDRSRARLQLAALLQAKPSDVTDYEGEQARLVRKVAGYTTAIEASEQIGARMLKAAWSSTSPLNALNTDPAAPKIDLEALYTAWQRAEDKSEFISLLDLHVARALVDIIVIRVPAGTPTKRALGRKEAK